MRGLKFVFPLILLLLLNLIAKSEIFVVTSKSDSGQGTLREALTKAAQNGSLTVDEIRFNLPGTTDADKTITLLSELPHVRSKTIIDASTQPGNKFGRSNAKIAICPDLSVYVNPGIITAGFFIEDAQFVEIYSFYIYNFSEVMKNRFPGSGSLFHAGIYVHSSSDVIIGGPERGNVIVANTQAIYVNGDYTIEKKSERIKIQSNWVGFRPDGTMTTYGGVFMNGHESVLGGDTPEKGNVFCAGPISFGGNNVVIRYNQLGIDLDGKPISTIVALSTHGDIFTHTNYLFADNVANKFYWDLLRLKNLTVVRNRNLNLAAVFLSGIKLDQCMDAIIGTGRDEDANILLGNPITANASKGVQVRKNSIICTDKPFSSNDISNPKIEVFVNDATEYSGTATPNSEIYIYHDNTDCEVCNPVELYATVIADASGMWKITGDFSKKKFLANATLDKTSSEFTAPKIGAIDGYAFASTNPSCDKNDGTIKLLNLTNVLKVEWFDINDQKVAEGVEAKNLGPGRYYAKCSNGQCFIKSFTVDLVNLEPTINDASIDIKQPGCGADNGSITGLIVASSDLVKPELKWVDKNNNVIKTGSSDISGLGAGEYTFIVSNPGNCIKTYGPVIFKNSSGSSINTDNMLVRATTCGEATGGVSGITVTGRAPFNYSWKNEKSEIVSTSLDLIDVPAGKYTIEMKDQSACGVLKSAPIEIIEENGVIISEAHSMNKASCGKKSGSLTNILVTGATKYEWFSENGELVGTSKDLLNVASGRYKLRASNLFCQQETPYYVITELSSIPFPDYVANIESASCSINNGSVKIDFGVGLQPSAMKWINAAGMNLGVKKEISGLDAGQYMLYLTDAQGCEVLYQTYSITRIAPLSIDLRSVVITRDLCLNGKGAIEGIVASEGVPPYTYTWTDAANKVIGNTANVTAIKAGVYKLTIKDGAGAGCREISRTFTVLNQEAAMPSPEINDLSICAPGLAVLKVNNVRPGIYRLYENIESPTALSENNAGLFTVTANNRIRYYLSYSDGSCESQRVPVEISVSSTDIDIPNSISPNGDGINDFWEIKGVESYPAIEVSIVNRYGQLVYHSRGYQNPFSGDSKGMPLPNATYYYIIKLREGCEILKGSIAIIR